MELYVLRIDNYNEWSWENGACNLMGVYDTKEKALTDLLKYINIDMDEGRYLDYTTQDWCDYKNDNERENFYIDIYENKNDYDNGRNMGTYVIEKKILNDLRCFV